MHYEGDTALETNRDLARKATIIYARLNYFFFPGSHNSEGDVFAECLVFWTSLMMCSPSVKFYEFRDGGG